jgi:hypothetical protein
MGNRRIRGGDKPGSTARFSAIEPFNKSACQPGFFCAHAENRPSKTGRNLPNLMSETRPHVRDSPSFLDQECGRSLNYCRFGSRFHPKISTAPKAKNRLIPQAPKAPYPG